MARVPRVPPPAAFTCTQSVTDDLAAIAALDGALARSGLAASALALAAMVDDVENSATSRSMCARELRETLDRLRELAPAQEEADGIDELTKRRAARFATA